MYDLPSGDTLVIQLNWLAVNRGNQTDLNTWCLEWPGPTLPFLTLFPQTNLCFFLSPLILTVYTGSNYLVMMTSHFNMAASAVYDIMTLGFGVKMGLGYTDRFTHWKFNNSISNVPNFTCSTFLETTYPLLSCNSLFVVFVMQLFLIWVKMYPEKRKNVYFFNLIYWFFL